MRAEQEKAAIKWVKDWTAAMWKEKRREQLADRRRRQLSRTGSMFSVKAPPENGKREVARRQRQIAAGQIKVGE